jgi:hypothetical protein
MNIGQANTQQKADVQPGFKGEADLKVWEEREMFIDIDSPKWPSLQLGVVRIIDYLNKK